MKKVSPHTNNSQHKSNPLLSLHSPIVSVNLKLSTASVDRQVKNVFDTAALWL